MRLWHYKLIPHLPRQQLLGQHRECCALRGNGWGRKHSTVDYVFKYNYMLLYFYHCHVMEEMSVRGYKIDGKWFNENYRGKEIGYVSDLLLPNISVKRNSFTYPEHNDKYLQECLENLKNKGIVIDASRLY